MRTKKPKKFTDRLIEEQRKQNQKIEDLIWNVNTTEPTNQLTGNITQESAGRITQASFTDTPKDAPTKSDIQELLSYVSKYEQLKEVIKNMIDRLDEGSEMTLTKDSIIVLALKEAIK